MTGRLEEELKIEEKIKCLINNKPIIILRYYNSFMNETYNTKRNYITHVIEFVNFMEKEYEMDFNDYKHIKSIKTFHINEFLNNFTYKKNNDGAKNTNTYIANKLSALRNFFEFLCDNEIIEQNPCSKIKTPRDNRLHNIIYLTKDEINIIKDNINNGVGSKQAINYQKKWKSRDLAIVMLGITTGLRVSAICNINIEDVSFYNKSIRVIEKGDIEKDVYVPDNVLDIVKSWIEEREEILNGKDVNALFISSQKKRISTQSVRIMLRKYTYNINKNITPHKLRSTTATNLLEQTGDIALVADVLGHKNLQNTKRYALVSNKKKIDAANILGSLV